MSFRKGVNFVQLERDELVEYRPVLLYITAPVRPKDFISQTPNHKHFTKLPSLPEGVLKRDANPYNLCLIEVNPDLELLKEQISAALGEYKKAAHKVIIVNGHGSPEGVILKETPRGSAEVILDGRQLAQFISPHTHGHNLHVFAFFAHGHTFASQFYSYVHDGTPADVSNVVAISYFTSKDKPTAWDMISTAGNGNVEVTRESREFVKTIIRPNNPYNTLEEKIKP